MRNTCSAEIADILYRKSNPEGLNRLDGIKHTVRQQVLAEVSPFTNELVGREDVAVDR